jgi:hypothetical protein
LLCVGEKVYRASCENPVEAINGLTVKFCGKNSKFGEATTFETLFLMYQNRINSD